MFIQDKTRKTLQYSIVMSVTLQKNKTNLEYTLDRPGQARGQTNLLIFTFWLNLFYYLSGVVTRADNGGGAAAAAVHIWIVVL